MLHASITLRIVLVPRYCCFYYLKTNQTNVAKPLNTLSTNIEAASELTIKLFRADVNNFIASVHFY